MKRKLQILIPTFNREVFLKKNLENLEVMINDLNLQDRVSILVSNNCSSDTTKSYLDNLSNSNIEIYNQANNLGLEKNTLFCLKKSTKDYVMYLGDDDYICLEYLKTVINIIDLNSDLSTIVSNFYPVDINMVSLGANRDAHSSGIENMMKRFDILKNVSWRAHQMSGIVFKRDGIYESYIDNKVSNIYPFVFFITKSAMNGKCFHIIDLPVAVTSPGQDNKDWSYGNDGLLDDFFNNYKCMPDLTYIQRVRLEYSLLKNQSWRFIRSFSNSPLLFFQAAVSSKNTTIVTKFSYLFRASFSFYRYVKRRFFK